MRVNNKLVFALFIFTFAFSVRLWNLNLAGRTWDEPEYVEQGYKMIELLKAGKFNDTFFYKTYDHPPLVKYVYGLTAHLDAVGEKKDGIPLLRYDLTYSRLLSAFVSSLAVVLGMFFGWQFFSRFVGVTAAIILSLIPTFLGFSQLVTTESFSILLFTACVYLYVLLFEKFSWRKVVLCGIMTGIALEVKQSNGLLWLLLIGMYVLHQRFQKKRKHIMHRQLFLKTFFSIVAISITVFFLLWPMAILHLPEIYGRHRELWSVKLSPHPLQVTVSVPEVFFGRLMLTPIFYYLVYFFITTPLLILGLFGIGAYRALKSRKWHLLILLVWFCVPFILSFYAWRQHGVRYIVQIYVPMALLAAISLEIILKKYFQQGWKKLIVVCFLILYLFIPIYILSPYYIDYFNGIVGGTKGVFKSRSFQIGWWGEGIREAGMYIQHHTPQGAKIGIALSPSHVFPPIENRFVEKYQENKTYDYVVVNYYNILREGFDDRQINKNYDPIYRVDAGGAILATVYKRKNLFKSQ